MGEVLRTTTEPIVGQIRLAWWRDRLQELDAGTAPAEPRLQAASRELLPAGLTGAELAALSGGWWRLFDPFPWDIQTAEAIWFRGRYLFGLAARIVGGPSEDAEAAGGAWALVDVARHCSDPKSRAMLLEQARTQSEGLTQMRFPPVLRPLSMLAAVARRDALKGEPFEAEGRAARLALMLHHRLTGRI